MSEQPRRRRRPPQDISNQTIHYSTESKSISIIGLVTLAIIIIFVILYEPDSTSSGNSSSSYSNYNKSKSSSYDRYYSNDEIRDFINSYDGKW